MRRNALVLAAGLGLVGSIDLIHAEGVSSLSAVPVEVPFGVLAAGSAIGANATNASASVAGTLLSTTTHLWHLNNTNATSTYFAKIDLYASSGVSNLVSLTIGIDNGTQTAQVTGTLGALTQTSGAYVALPPGSAGTIYVTQAVSVLGVASALQMTVTVADDEGESASVVTRASLAVT